MTTNAKKHLEKLCGKLTLGGVIRSIRLCDEISQTDFAKLLNVSTQYLCDLEHGRKSVSPKKANDFALRLGYSPEQFVALAIQDALDHEGINMLVEVKAA
ncbi:MAG: helix-turn-helix transcriptional regulator [Legionellales bacterium]|nr:helix-turn-helix transcriptional regulator [Legionellales bacterium]